MFALDMYSFRNKETCKVYKKARKGEKHAFPGYLVVSYTHSRLSSHKGVNSLEVFQQKDGFTTHLMRMTGSKLKD